MASFVHDLGSPRDRGRARARGAAIGATILATILVPWLTMLVACPGPPPAAPRPEVVMVQRAPEAAAPSPTPGAEPSVRPPAEPTAEPAVEPDPSRPDARPDERMSPLAEQLRRALEEVDAGDASAMARAMLPTGRWFPPGRIDESVGTDQLDRAMRPWTNPNIDLALRRVVDLGRNRIAVQLTVHDREQPALRWELALVVDAHDDRISNIRQYGDALGPVRPRPEDPGTTLALGSVGEISVDGGPPKVPNVAATNRLVEALHANDAAAIRSLVSETVVLHDITARRTSRGPDAYVSGLREALGEHGRLDLLHHHATARFVVIEGTIHGRETDDDGTPWEHGFLDLHRFEDGRIVETWRYVNRRGRPRIDVPPATVVRP